MYLMNTANLINWFIIFAYTINCASFIKGSTSLQDTGGAGMRRVNLIKGKTVKYYGVQKQRGKDCGSTSNGFLPIKYYYLVPIFDSYILSNPITTFSEKLFTCIASKRHPNLSRYSVLGGLFLSGSFLFDYFDETVMKQILPNEVVRMGSALIATASICIDYRLQEFLHTDMNACHHKASVKIGKLCAMNGGLYIKAAQHLASMDHLLPKSYIKELSKLQDQAPASSMKVIEQVFKEELGRELTEVFSDICDIPIGSASVGQVHLAKLRSTGEQIALKIQHPNIKTDAEIDLESFKLALKIVKQVFPAVNLDWIVDELRSCLDSELNFELEAENSKKAKVAFEKDSKFKKIVLVPKVYDDLTSERVLTMEFVPGFKINDTERMKAAGLDLNKINALMYEVFMEMIFKHNFVHCDPHPGNILVTGSSGNIKIVLLDHGIYKSVSPDIVAKFSKLFLAILEKDLKMINELSAELNISIEILEEIRNLLKNLLKKDRKSLDSDALREEISDFIMKQPEAKKRQASEALRTVPREFFFIIKVLDLLRSNERSLTRENPKMVPTSLIVLTKRCINYVEDPEKNICPIFAYFKLLKSYYSSNF